MNKQITMLVNESEVGIKRGYNMGKSAENGLEQLITVCLEGEEQNHAGMRKNTICPSPRLTLNPSIACHHLKNKIQVPYLTREVLPGVDPVTLQHLRRGNTQLCAGSLGHHDF